MIAWYLLFLIFPIAALNRFARGESKWKRWQWYLFNYIIATAFSGQYQFGLLWLFFCVSYATPPNSPVFSALSGTPPTREDHWLFNWIQRLSHWVLKRLYGFEDDYEPLSGVYWKSFGIAAGTIHGILMLPAVMMIANHLDSYLPMIGAMFLLKGLIYHFAGKQAERLNAGNVAVAIAEAPLLGVMMSIFFIVCVSI